MQRRLWHALLADEQNVARARTASGPSVPARTVCHARTARNELIPSDFLLGRFRDTISRPLDTNIVLHLPVGGQRRIVRVVAGGRLQPCTRPRWHIGRAPRILQRVWIALERIKKICVITPVRPVLIADFVVLNARHGRVSDLPACDIVLSPRTAVILTAG